MGRIAGLVLLLLPCVTQAQEAIPSPASDTAAGKVVSAQVAPLSGKQPTGKSRNKSAPAADKNAAKATTAEEAQNSSTGKESEAAPEESVQLKGLRG